MKKDGAPADRIQKDFDRHARVLDFKPLDKENLQQAIDLAVTIFGDGDREAITEEFSGSLDPNSNLPFIGSSQFFLVYKNEHPVGVTGYYSIPGHPEDIWLDWMGVLPQYRENGIGTQLVQHGFIDKAKPDVKTLRIWTTLEKDYDKARSLYKKMGFIEEPYKPDATDAAKMVVVFYRSTDPKADKGYLWKNSAYPMDCEEHVIPDLNKQLGLGAADGQNAKGADKAGHPLTQKPPRP